MNTTKKKPLNENAKKWVAALRSGKYRQCRNTLTKVNGDKISHCCLGVACEVYIKSGGKLNVETTQSKDVPGKVKSYGNKVGALPKEVQTWLGLKNNSGGFDKFVYGQLSLASLNDNQIRFTTIANVIESQPEGLFAS